MGVQGPLPWVYGQKGLGPGSQVVFRVGDDHRGRGSPYRQPPGSQGKVYPKGSRKIVGKVTTSSCEDQDAFPQQTWASPCIGRQAACGRLHSPTRTRQLEAAGTSGAPRGWPSSGTCTMPHQVTTHKRHLVTSGAAGCSTVSQTQMLE